MSKDVLLLVICGLVTLASCKSDEKSGIDYDLAGKWDVYEAYRNKTLTTTLEDGYFLFQDSVLETNIIGSPISGNFSLVENTFQHESELPAQYRIGYYSSDTIHLNTQIQGFKFLFKLTRATDSDEDQGQEQNI